MGAGLLHGSQIPGPPGDKDKSQIGSLKALLAYFQSRPHDNMSNPSVVAVCLFSSWRRRPRNL